MKFSSITGVDAGISFQFDHSFGQREVSFYFGVQNGTMVRSVAIK